jgi:Flp pilus assembly pilin Flp
MIAPTMKALVRKLVEDKRGAVTTEYVVLVGTVALGLAAAIFSLGPGLVSSYEQTRSVIASP